MSANEMKHCFAYSNNKCSILKVRNCDGSGCRFYKTEVQLKKDRHKAIMRIKSLNKQTRNDIIDTYFDGKRKLLKEQ